MGEARQTLQRYRRLQDGGDAAGFWAEAFRRLLEVHRRDDGSVWSHAALERATGGVAPRHFCSDLARGNISEPAFAKIWAIALALGANLDEWTEGLDSRADKDH